MAKRDGMYSSNKRKKELQRKKKQDEKTQKRLHSSKNPSQKAAEVEPVNPETGSDEGAVQEDQGVI